MKMYRCLLLSAVLVFISNCQLLGFTFWHDDYTHLYKAQQGILSLYPYQLFSILTPILYRLFGLNHILYICVGMILIWVSSLLVYQLTKELFDSKNLGIASMLLFAASYLGQDSMKMFVGDGIGTLPVLPLVLTMFIFIIKDIKKNSNIYFICEILLFTVIEGFAPHRYIGLFIPILLLYWISWFLKRDKKIFKSIIFKTVIILSIFYFNPIDMLIGYEHQSISGLLIQKLQDLLSFQTTLVQTANFGNLFYSSYFIEVITTYFNHSLFLSLLLSSLLFWIIFSFAEYLRYSTNFIRIGYLTKLIMFIILGVIAYFISLKTTNDLTLRAEFINGVLFICLIIFTIFKNRKDRNLFLSIAFISIMLTFIIAAPTLSMSSTYRYIMSFSFFVPILLISILVPKKYYISPPKAFWLSIFFLITINVVFANLVLYEFSQKYTSHFKKIYADLYKEIPQVDQKFIIYMEPSSTQIGWPMYDAFRVGELPTQAAYAALYKTSIDNFILPETKQEIIPLAEKFDIPKERVYVFYYNGKELIRENE